MLLQILAAAVVVVPNSLPAELRDAVEGHPVVRMFNIDYAAWKQLPSRQMDCDVEKSAQDVASTLREMAFDGELPDYTRHPMIKIPLNADQKRALERQALSWDDEARNHKYACGM